MIDRKIKIGSDFSGVGAFNQALIRLGIPYKEVFACDMDKYARQTFCLNFGNEKDIELSKLPTPTNLEVALKLKNPKITPALRKSQNSKDFSFYYPTDVYEREIPKESLDIYMTSPPCQAFSLAGKRKGEEDSINFSVPNSQTRRGRVGKKVSQTLDTQCNQGVYTQQRIRRLTPLECFRLMDFNENFVWNVSDSQAYKQAGNSICVGVLAAIISKLNLK